MLGIPNIILAAIVSAFTFSDDISIASYLAIMVTVITIIMTFLNPSDKASTHSRCAGEYLSLRNKSRIFKNIISETKLTDGEMIARFEELTNKRDNLNSASPQIPRFAYEKAKRDIQAGESTHSV